VLFEHLIALQDSEPHDAALNMAIDEALLVGASAPILRLYRWARPAVSFGYFEKWTPVAQAWPRCELVRRWTGGGVVLHGDDLTYTLIVPRAHRFSTLSPRESYARIHAALANVLGGTLADAAPPKISTTCFENPAQHDVMFAGRKIAGAAQRRTQFGLLHQGSIQPAEDRERVGRALPAAFGENIELRKLDPAQLADARQLAAAKYATAAWTQRA
jgi:lipoate-protein ligase A